MPIAASHAGSRSEPDIEELLALAHRCAATAAAVLTEHFTAPARGVRTKSGPKDMVSAADLAAEDAIRTLLARERPDDGVLGEEHPETASRSGLRWVVDPLDGTLNYLQRIPHWSVSVGCEDSRGALAGVVHDPLRDEWFAAARGRGATLGQSRLSGSDADDLALATVGGEFSARTPAQGARSQRLLAGVGHARAYGSAALDLAWAAAGRFDAVYHGRFPSPWDVSAGSLLCLEAGLSVERLTGEEGRQPWLLAAPPSLATPLRDLLCG